MKYRQLSVSGQKQKNIPLLLSSQKRKINAGTTAKQACLATDELIEKEGNLLNAPGSVQITTCFFKITYRF